MVARCSVDRCRLFFATRQQRIFTASAAFQRTPRMPMQRHSPPVRRSRGEGGRRRACRKSTPLAGRDSKNSRRSPRAPARKVLGFLSHLGWHCSFLDEKPPLSWGQSVDAQSHIPTNSLTHIPSRGVNTFFTPPRALYPCGYINRANGSRKGICTDDSHL